MRSVSMQTAKWLCGLSDEGLLESPLVDFDRVVEELRTSKQVIRVVTVPRDSDAVWTVSAVDAALRGVTFSELWPMCIVHIETHPELPHLFVIASQDSRLAGRV